MIPSRPGFCVAARLGILTRQAMALHETLKIICRLSIGEAFVVLESQLGLQDWVTHSSVATGTATSPKDAHGEPSCIRSIYNQIVRCMSRQSHNVADWWASVSDNHFPQTGLSPECQSFNATNTHILQAGLSPGSHQSFQVILIQHDLYTEMSIEFTCR